MEKFPRSTFLAILCLCIFACNNDEPIEESTANIDDFVLLSRDKVTTQQYDTQNSISSDRFSNMKSILDDDREL